MKRHWKLWGRDDFLIGAFNQVYMGESRRVSCVQANPIQLRARYTTIHDRLLDVISNVWTNWCIDRPATDAMYTDATTCTYRKYMRFSIYVYTYISVIWNYNYTRDGGKNRIRSFQMGHHIGIKIEEIRRKQFHGSVVEFSPRKINMKVDVATRL